MSYFEKLPIINYDGYTVRNILARSKISNATKGRSSIFYPYTMTEEDRIDILSDKYYDDPMYAWLVWMANDVIDPYYDLYINDDDFNSFITEKYGSIETAQRRIKHYINNWYGDDTVLTVTSFNALNSSLKKYYTPVLDDSLSISKYERKKKNWIANTNRVITLEISSANGSLILDEEVKCSLNSGFVTFANSSVVTLQHITGSFSSNTTITGQSSGATAHIDTSTVINETIPNDELSYWTSVSYYDYEIEKNSINKEIKLIDNRFKQTVDSELKRSMS